jgi:hypothetical protein
MLAGFFGQRPSKIFAICSKEKSVWGEAGSRYRASEFYQFIKVHYFY